MARIESAEDEIMNVNPLIEEALEDIGCPTAALTYDGDEDTYIVYTVWSEKPTEYADDEAVMEKTSVTVNIYSGGDLKELRKKVRQQLRKAGFSIVDTREMYNKEVKRVQVSIEIVYECVPEEADE